MWPPHSQDLADHLLALIGIANPDADERRGDEDGNTDRDGECQGLDNLSSLAIAFAGHVGPVSAIFTHGLDRD